MSRQETSNQPPAEVVLVVVCACGTRSQPAHFSSHGGVLEKLFAPRWVVPRSIVIPRRPYILKCTHEHRAQGRNHTMGGLCTRQRHSGSRAEGYLLRGDDNRWLSCPFDDLRRLPDGIRDILLLGRCHK
jgi:hypothetical protein